MDANRDEALKCVSIAKAAMENDDIAKALKFLSKADNMYPTDEVKELLQKCRAKAANSTTRERPPRPNDTTNPTKDNSTSRVAAEGSRVDAKTAALNRECAAILNCKSYYEVLGVSRNASDDEIKRAYKKLVLKYHPDKNPSKRAGEAFNKISDAFQCLSDRKLRDHYDRFGRDPGDHVNRGHYAHHHHEVFMTPDALFEALFGMSVPHRRRPHQNAHSTQQTTSTRSTKPQQATPDAAPNQHGVPLFYLLPFLALLFMMFVSNLIGNEVPAFQFTRSPHYNQMVSTQLNAVVYYVDGRTFDRAYPPSSQARVKLEYEVDYNYFDGKCSQDKRDNHTRAYAYISRMKTPPKEVYDLPHSCQVFGSLRSTYEDYLRSHAYRARQ